MLIKHIDQLLAAFDVLNEKSMAPAGLALLYVAIDSMAQISSLKQGPMGERFRSFCQKYLDLYGLKVDADDLWSSRCGVLHSWSAQSDISASGKAHEIFFYWGSARREVLDAVLVDREPRTKAVSLNALANAVRDAATRLERDIEANADLLAHWKKLAESTFVDVFVPRS